MSGGEFYKGRRRGRRWPWVLLIIFLCLITAAVLLFYGLQKYIVYTPEGLRLDLPVLATPTPALPEDGDGEPSVSTDGALIIDETDYTSMAAVAGENLSPVRAIFVPYEDVTAEALPGYADRLSSGNALVLELKTESGQLIWASENETAVGYGLAGSLDLVPVAASLKERDVWLVAQISCLVDELMASRNEAMTLKRADGSAYSDSEGRRLDPYNQDLRAYIVALCLELREMGFDEVLLDNVSHPAVDPAALSYAVTSTNASAVTAVTGFCSAIRRDLADSGLVISALASRAAIVQEEGLQNGQSIEAFIKLFDRIYCYTDASGYATYMTACEALITLGDVNTRFVPICYANLPDTDCWVLTDNPN